MKRVVIVGGGYAGLRVARDLARTARALEVEIILVSQADQHLEAPSLYEVATAYLGRESVRSGAAVCHGVWAPLSELVAQLPVRLHIGQVTAIDTRSHLLLFQDHSSLSYDYLVLAVGAALATYRIPGVDEHTFSIKTLNEALRLRHHIIRQFHLAHQLNQLERQAALTFIVVGGGAAGVEIAAELKGLIDRLCRQLGVDPHLPALYLLEAGPEILREVPHELRHRAQQRLNQRGVQLMTRSSVAAVEAGAMLISDGQRLATKTVIWAAGLRPHELLSRSDLPLRGWGVDVEPTLQVVGHPEIFAAGDCAVIVDSLDSIPATVRVAYTQGALVARNLVHRTCHEPLEPYQYKSPGQIITLGGKNALLILPNGQGLMGWVGWAAKRLVSLRYWLGYLPFFTALPLWWRGVMVQTKND